jgi:prevent-host-death family protein
MCVFLIIAASAKLTRRQQNEEAMPKKVSASEAKNRLGAIMGWVVEHQDEVIIESRGEPTVVLMPFSEYEKTKELREQDRRRKALAQLESLRERVSARNQDLNEEQAMELADRFVREVIDEMVEEGKIKFKKG